MKVSTLLFSIFNAKWLIAPSELINNASLLAGIINKSLELEETEKPKASVYSAGNGNVIQFNSKTSMVDFTGIQPNSVLVLPVRGTMMKYGTMCSWGMDELAATLQQASTNKNIVGCILDIHSGGGAVDAISFMEQGIDTMHSANKPVVVWGDTVASAAYYGSLKAKKILAQNTISSEFGSIGVMASWIDASEAMEKMGYKLIKVYAPESEEKNLPFEMALKGDFEKIKIEYLSPLAKKFIADVKSYRPQMAGSNERIFKGAMLYAEDALKEHMIDGIATFDQAIKEVYDLAKTSGTSGKPNKSLIINQPNPTMKKFATLMAILAISGFEFPDGKASLSEEQIEKIKADFKNKFGRELNLENISYDADKYASLTENDLELIEKAFQTASAATATEAGKNKTETIESETETARRLAALEAENARNKELIASLGNKPETIALETVAKVIEMRTKAQRKIIVAGGHLFGESDPWNKVDSSRSWNQAALARITGDHKAFELAASTTIDQDQLISDLGAFISGRVGEIQEWFKGNDVFESIFPSIAGVKEGQFFSSVDVAEVTQAYQKAWTPKGDVKFKARKPRLFDIKIDLELENLKSIERTWLSEFNTEGSAAYKMTFVEYIINMVIRKAIMEDQIAQVNGEYKAPTASVAGLHINKMDGIRTQLYQLVDERLAKPFSNIGEWNSTNVIDVTNAMISALPEDVRNRPGLGLYGSTEYIKSYWEKRRVLEGTMPTYDPKSTTVPGYDNIRLIGVPWMGNSKRLFITPIGNVRQLFGENDGEGRSLFVVEKTKRLINIFADYKRAIWFLVAGFESATAQEFLERDYSKQLVWFNNADIPSETYKQVESNLTVLDASRHKYLETVSNSAATAITNITGGATGDIIYIRCGSLTNASTIADSGNFLLTSAWEPTEVGEILSLIQRSDGKFVELERTAPSTEADPVEFTANDVTPSVADALIFITSDSNTSADKTLTTLDDAEPGSIYKIYGGGGTYDTIIPNSGNFELTAEWTGAASSWIRLFCQATDRFIEIERSA